MRRALSQLGVEEDRILEAGNGQEGLKALEAGSVSLVLLDLNMPVMDGEEFLTEMRAQQCFDNVSVLIITTESNAGRLMKLGRLGITGFLHKPFEPEDLREIAAQALGKAS